MTSRKTRTHRQQVEDAITELMTDVELTPLERLNLVNDIRSWMQQEAMPHAVQAALGSGVSWEDVGVVFGTSKLGAQHQWGRRLAARRRNHQ